MRDAKAGAGADDGDRPGFGKRLVGAGQPLEIARVRLRDRMAHRLEIIDQYVAVDAELLVYQRGANDPRSEEHTSELQSLMRISYAVFCLKKKTKDRNNNN